MHQAGFLPAAVTGRGQVSALLTAAGSGGGIGVGLRAAGSGAIVTALVLTAILVGAAQQALP
jgi:hypothetical protein